MSGLAAESITAERLRSTDPGLADAALVAQAKSGDAQLFALLYWLCLDRIYDFVSRRVD